jgi:Ca2+-binding EF-hand superfamily protein
LKEPKIINVLPLLKKLKKSLTLEKEGDVENYFRSIDKNKDGIIDFSEFNFAFRSFDHELTAEEMLAIF